MANRIHKFFGSEVMRSKTPLTPFWLPHVDPTYPYTMSEFFSLVRMHPEIALSSKELYSMLWFAEDCTNHVGKLVGKDYPVINFVNFELKTMKQLLLAMGNLTPSVTRVVSFEGKVPAALGDFKLWTEYGEVTAPVKEKSLSGGVIDHVAVVDYDDWENTKVNTPCAVSIDDVLEEIRQDEHGADVDLDCLCGSIDMIRCRSLCLCTDECDHAVKLVATMSMDPATGLVPVYENNRVVRNQVVTMRRTPNITLKLIGIEKLILRKESGYSIGEVVKAMALRGNIFEGLAETGYCAGLDRIFSAKDGYLLSDVAKYFIKEMCRGRYLNRSPFFCHYDNRPTDEKYRVVSTRAVLLNVWDGLVSVMPDRDKSMISVTLCDPALTYIRSRDMQDRLREKLDFLDEPQILVDGAPLYEIWREGVCYCVYLTENRVCTALMVDGALTCDGWLYGAVSMMRMLGIHRSVVEMEGNDVIMKEWTSAPINAYVKSYNTLKPFGVVSFPLFSRVKHGGNLRGQPVVARTKDWVWVKPIVFLNYTLSGGMYHLALRMHVAPKYEYEAF